MPRARSTSSAPGTASTEPLEEIDWTGHALAARERRADRGAAAAPRSGASRAPAAADRGDRPRDVPTVRELQLERELTELRERLAAAEAALGRRSGLFGR